MSILEDDFEKRWKRLYPEIELTRGGVGSFAIIGVDKTRSQVDFYNEEAKVIIEINGATWKGKAGAHSSGTGLRRDFTKQLLAQTQGWLYYELDSIMIKDRGALGAIALSIHNRIRAEVKDTAIVWEQWKHLFPTAKSKAKSKIKSTADAYED